MVFGIKATVKRNNNLKWQHVPADSLKLAGLRALIIGGTGGIGQGISRRLHAQGASVTVVGRTYRDDDIADIQFIEADLELMSEASRVGRELAGQPFDLVLLTAGIVAGMSREETVEGIERDMAVSFLSRLVILRAILPALESVDTHIVAQPRVFVMGYPGAGVLGDPEDLNSDRTYSPVRAHMNTVACNEALVLDCARRYPCVRFYGLNPGLIRTNIRDNLLAAGSWKSRLVEGFIGYWYQSVDEYAQRTAPLLVTPALESHSPAFFNGKGQAIYSQGFTNEHVTWLIKSSETLARRAGVAL
ncbi:Oxidoreductase [Lachancea thermotolerans]|uniref:KLTH0G19360p n=1 Tax=Lachancea thermotolerans (strain ATCC 56472 / CBS 6340 / NRRL Y-8284) TaxID=559295 RepID=C5DNS1_LACTC|nr:KLTH0G19360p [Lachancea thermotolerans CBS 6340]CAR25432.1 KLTH0G19360p [Lachancea thermotolerans CBS 6340]